MDHIIPTNIHSISSCDLNTKFNDRSHADWSKSNLIAFVTLEGIYILKPQLDNPQGPFQIQLIRIPNTKFKHNVISPHISSFDSHWQTLNHVQYMDIFLNPALTTNVDKLSLDIYPRRFRMAKWSPVIDVFPRQCILATITVDYQLCIYHHRDHSWDCLIDLSSEYDLVWSQINSNEIQESKNDFNRTSRILHCLSFCCICWKESKSGDPYLIAATVTGDVVIWKINFEAEERTISKHVSLITILKTNLEYINSMQLVNDFLFISVIDGQVVLYDLTQAFSKPCSINENQQVNEVDIRLVSPVATLWHKDNIEVPDFYIQPLSSNLFRIVLSKSTNICWANIGFEMKAGDSVATLTISDSYSAIDGLDPDVSLHQTPATWLKPAGDKRAVLIADDGSFFQLEFSDDDRQDCIPDFDAIRTGKIDLTRMVPRGLCTSPNGHLISMISSITLQYEPAKILAPTKVILLPTLNDWKFFVDCLNKLLDVAWLESRKISSPMEVCDRVDYIISIYPILNSEQFIQLYKILKQAIMDSESPKTDTQITKHKIAGLIALKMLKFRQSKIDGDSISLVEKTVHETIFNYYLEKQMSLIFDGGRLSEKDDEVSLTNVQVNSLRNYITCLDMSPNRAHLKDRYGPKINDFLVKYSSAPIENCPICQAEVSFESLKHGICRNQHVLHRCARTLTVIDLKNDQDLVCETCEQHYSKKLIWPTNQLWLCIFCQ